VGTKAHNFYETKLNIINYSFLPENPERKLENDRVRWPILAVGDGATGDGGSGVVWGEDTDDDCSTRERGRTQRSEVLVKTY
jgi:hypothetical protein